MSTIFRRLCYLAMLCGSPAMLCAGTVSAQGNADTDPATPVTAQTFASRAATMSQAEIEFGQLARKNGQDESVKTYGQRMIKDHTAADAKLKAIAAKENLTLPTNLDAEHRTAKAKLASLHGEAFDAAYRAEMAKGHDRAVALFASASQATTLPSDLRQFAASTLPTLQEHQKLAHSLGEDHQNTQP